MTLRRYLEDPYDREISARVTACEGGWCSLSESVFFPGGGGQPCDRGELRVGDERLAVTAMREDDGGLWHAVGRDLAVGTTMQGAIDWPFRHALMRHHALLHIVNTLAHHLGGAVTGCQLGPERSRIDLKLPVFAREQGTDLEARVNEVIARDLAIESSTVDEDELRRRPELVRTLRVAPPVTDGKARVVTIASFDAQACGGTHVHRTGEIGRARLVRFDNKGKDNKRFYWELDG